MPNRVRVLSVSDADRAELERRVGCSEPTVVAWRARYAERGLAGLEVAPRSGRPPLVDDAKRYAILSKTLTPPPLERGITHWSSRLLAAQFDVDHATVARRWAECGIRPHRFATFKFSTDPELEVKVRDVAGLYLHPPLVDTPFPKIAYGEVRRFKYELGRSRG